MHDISSITSTLQVFLTKSPTCLDHFLIGATFLTHHTLLELRFKIILGEE
jgi:hypothetical protein